MEQIERVRCFAAQNSAGKIDNGLFAGKSKNIEDIALADFFPAKRDQLIEHRFRVAQSAFSAAGDRVRGCGLERDLFLAGDELQVLCDQVCRDAMQIKTLAATQNRRQNFLRFGCGEDKFYVRRRFFERFEERVERGL